VGFGDAGMDLLGGGGEFCILRVCGRPAKEHRESNGKTG